MQEERRKSKRMELDSTLVIKRLDDDSKEEISIVIDDVSKYQRLKKLVPEFCGFFCNSNAFGLGMVTQIKRQATIIK